MHIVCHASVALLSGSFAQYAWRQSNSYQMRMNVERCSGIIIHLTDSLRLTQDLEIVAVLIDWFKISFTLKIRCGIKMKPWNDYNNAVFKRMWLSMLLRHSTRGRISWTRCLAEVWGVLHRNSWSFVMLEHQEMHYWKIGKQVFRSLQRECSWLVQCQQIYQQWWNHQYQRLGITSLSGTHKHFPFSL